MEAMAEEAMAEGSSEVTEGDSRARYPHPERTGGSTGKLLHGQPLCRCLMCRPHRRWPRGSPCSHRRKPGRPVLPPPLRGQSHLGQEGGQGRRRPWTSARCWSLCQLPHREWSLAGHVVQHCLDGAASGSTSGRSSSAARRRKAPMTRWRHPGPALRC